VNHRYGHKSDIAGYASPPHIQQVDLCEFQKWMRIFIRSGRERFQIL